MFWVLFISIHKFINFKIKFYFYMSLHKVAYPVLSPKTVIYQTNGSG